MEFRSFTEKYIEKQWKLIVGVFAGLVLVGALWALIANMSIKKEKLAQEDYFKVEKKLLELKAKQTPLENPLEKKDIKKDSKKDEVVDFSQSKKDLEKLISEHKGSVASQMAALHLANLLVAEKNQEGALAALKNVENKNKGLVNTLVQKQIGQLLADQSKCQEALNIWQKILDRKEAGFLHSETKIQQALCYVKMNDLKRAEEILTNLANQSLNPDIGDNSSSKEAEKYLRLIQFKKTSGS